MFTPVGGTQPLRVDVRLIASTNKDLEEEIAKGNFREDLFYRLNVVPFFVPPLRERKQDIPPLAREFLAEFGRQYGRPRMEIGEEALEALAQYHWPGNVRELKNVIERVLILNPRALRIERKHLPPLTHKAGTRSTEEFSTLQQARDAYEREYILKKDRRSPQQHEPRRGTAGPRAQPSLPQDEGAGHQRARVSMRFAQVSHSNPGTLRLGCPQAHTSERKRTAAALRVANGSRLSP